MSNEPVNGRFDVLISGASFAGLALARALTYASRGDLRIGLADRSIGLPERPDARAFALSAASRHMLEMLGVWQGVAAEAEPVLEIEITDSSLEAAVRPVLLRYANLLEDGEPASHIVPANRLLEALHQSVADDPTITFLAPAVAEGLEPGPHVATLTFADGRRARASLVVAAEGRRSRLREQAGLKVTGWGYGQTGIVTTLKHEKPHGGRAVQHFLPGGPFAILPLRANRSCVTWSETAAEAERIMALDDALFLDEIDLRFGGRLGAIALDGPRQCWPLEMHLARGYVAPRLALLGDTAHGVHPIAGQGLNLGLRDAAALAEVLVEAARLGLDIGSPAVLERYERWRRFDSTLSAAAFDGLNRLFSNDNALLRLARDLGLGLVEAMPGLKSRFVEEAAGLSGEVPRLLRRLAI
jgi:2-octaprenyl-6-methoxyphenol hydroxylase